MAKSRELAVRYYGEGLPVLIIHGWTMASFVEANDFEPIFIRTPGYRRIYLDLPGMGDTSIGDVEDLDGMLESVSTFIEQNVLPSNFLLVGTSCGAYLARALAYKYNSKIDGLLLRVPLIEPTSSKRDIDPFVPAISNEALMSRISEADHENLGDVPVQTREYVKASIRRAETTSLPAISASDSAALEPIRNDPLRYRSTSSVPSPEQPFTKPTLILTGRQDCDVGFRDAWGLRDCYPRATFVALDRADHGHPVDQIDQILFAALVEDWLRRVEELQRLAH